MRLCNAAIKIKQIDNNINSKGLVIKGVVVVLNENY